MRHFRIPYVLSILCILCFLPSSSFAQQDPELEVGMKPFGSYNGGNIDTVSLYHGQLSLDIPLISYPQRGGKLKLDFHLRYANIGAQANYVALSYPPYLQTFYYASYLPAGWCGGNSQTGGPLCHGFRVVDEQSVGYMSSSSIRFHYPSYDDVAGSQTVLMPDGATHALFPTCGNCSPPVWKSVDATSYQLQGSICGDGQGTTFYNQCGDTVVDPAGTKYVYPSSGQAYRQDTNGNTITYSGSGVGVTDTVGRVIPSIPAATSNVTACPQPPSVPYAPTSATTWNLPGVNGGNYPILFCYIQLSETNPIASTLPGQTVWQPYTYIGTELQSVVLPNGTSWTFEYTTDGNADLSEVIFPTGGTLSYGSWQHLGSLVIGTQSFIDYNRAVGVRTLNPNDGVTLPSTWTYAYSPSTLTTVSSPPSSGTTPPDDTVHTFTGYYETQTQYYQGSRSSGTLLRTTTTQYSSTPLPYGGYNFVSAINFVPSQTATVWPNGQQNKTGYAYDSGVNIYYPYWTCGAPCTFGSSVVATAIYGKVLNKSEYDYGNGAPGALLRTTTTSYLALNNSTYLSANLLDLPSSVQVTGSGPGAYTTFNYDETGSPAGAHGNLTSTRRWLNTNGSYLVTSNVYDTYGRVTSATDPKNNPPTTYGYLPYSCPTGTGYAGSGPTKVTNALGQVTYNCYDLTAGLLNSTTDPNSQTTSYLYDNMYRTTQVNNPDGGQATFAYPTPNEVDIGEKMDNSGHYKTASLLVDGLGRKIRQIASNGETTPYDQADTCYNGNGRVSFQSYPYQGNGFATARVCSGAGDSFAYDAFGRPTTVTHSDSSIISTSYTGNSTTVTDEQGKNRQSKTDGLGRLTQVIENPGGLNYTTAYTYDALDNLTGVTQAGSRPRTFVYDSLSRLTSSTNPEANWAPATQTNVATTYAYDANGNLVNKTEPAQNQQSTATVTLTYCYDPLNRLTAKAYTSQTCTNGWLPSPVATYVYDGGALPSGCSVGSFSYGLAIGKRTAMCDAAGSEAWSYNIVSGTGWQIVDQRTTNSVTKSTTYQNNLLGLPTAIQYPSGRTITYGYNLGARPVSATDGTTSVNYENTVHYWAGGAPCWTGYGGAITSAATFNPRLQPLAMQATSSVVPFTTCAGLGQTGNLLDLSYNFSLGSGDNGNVMGITNNRDATRSQTFAYDALNRLLTAQTTSTYPTSPAHCWGETFGYDTWGNFLSIGVASTSYNGCTQESLSVTASAQNRISTSGYVYDTAGNMTAAPPTGTTYNYNAENQLTATAGLTYTYDGDGKRVQKSNGPIYWYGMDGSVLDETDLTGSTTNSSFNEYVFFGGKRIARRDSSNNVFYYAADHLGTSRVIAQVPSGQSIATLCYDADFYPFGGERPPYINTCSQNYKFTAKERDSESNLDNFGARYHGSAIGRFTSVDPKVKSGLRMLAPQLWNMYAYAGNNPLKYYDPDGMELRLAPGLDKKTHDRIISDLAKTYRTPAGRAGLHKMDESPIKFTLGTASLPDNKREDGKVGRVYGYTDRTGEKGTISPDGKTVLTVDQSQSSVKIEYDFKKLDNSGEGGPSEKTVFNHELGHGVDIATDPVAEANKTDDEAHAAVENFLRDVSRDKTDMSMDAAKDAVQKMLNPPPPPRCNEAQTGGTCPQ